LGKAFPIVRSITDINNQQSQIDKKRKQHQQDKKSLNMYIKNIGLKQLFLKIKNIIKMFVLVLFGTRTNINRSDLYNTKGYQALEYIKYYE
jgi:hypothetical protein